MWSRFISHQTMIPGPLLLPLLLSGFGTPTFSLTGHYHFVSEKKSWVEAQSFCRRSYTDLATVEHVDDMSRLLESTGGTYNGSVWIGLYDDPLESWEWSLEDPERHSQAEKNHRNWYTVMMASGRDDCVHTFRNKWIVSPCENRNAFVCYDGRPKATADLILISEFKSWAEARSYCREHHTDLASIRNRDENRRISSLTNSELSWIGLYRTRAWSDRSNSSFRYYNSETLGHFDSATVTCTLVNYGDSGKWAEELCNASFPFVCYTATSHHEFHFEAEPKTWTEAQSFCRLKYTDLATVDDMEDMTRLMELVNGTYDGSAWIGLHDDQRDSWRWSLEDPQFYGEGEKDFRSWPQFPISGLKNYCAAAFYNLAWFDLPCHDTLPFICQDAGSDGRETHVLISEAKNWTDAQRYCRENHSDLVRIWNEQENLEIFSKLPRAFAVWIGLRKTITWSDRSNSTFAFWKSGEPDAGHNSVTEFLDQNCTAASLNESGRWSDENCLSTLPFVCYSLTPATTTTGLQTTTTDVSVATDHVVILKIKVSARGLSEDQVKQSVRIKLEEEFLKHGYPNNVTVRVRSARQTAP